MNVIPVCAFNDNYIWMIMHPGNSACVVVDPGDADPVLALLNQQRLSLKGILITHHHWDHVNGIAALLAKCPVPVFGPRAETIQGVSEGVQEGDTVHISRLNLHFQVFNIPAHTKGHIAYYGHSSVFCGDTLFTGGCGRLFEGTAAEMYTSLQKLAVLPDDTLVYCGHEYTEANLRFACLVEPDNPVLAQRLIATQQQRAQNRPTVPALLSLEKATNPFLRTHRPNVKKAAEQFAGTSLNDPIEVFAVLRRWKDGWVGV